MKIIKIVKFSVDTHGFTCMSCGKYSTELGPYGSGECEHCGAVR